MKSQFRGEAIYTAEVDVHFPNLTVGDTLLFAALARAPRHILGKVDKWTYATHVRDVTMAMLGIRSTVNTRVGDDFVRGGELFLATSPDPSHFDFSRKPSDPGFISSASSQLRFFKRC